METMTVIIGRRSVRGWTEEAVPQKLLQEVLEAGRLAPSPKNSQPWHFIVVRNRESILSLAKHAQHGSFLESANAVIVVAVSGTVPIDPWLTAHEQHVLSGACALQNMMLAAWDLGIGGCWVTMDQEKTHALLAIPPTYKILGSLAIGYPLSIPEAHKAEDRKPLGEIVSYERFSDGKT